MPRCSLVVMQGKQSERKVKNPINLKLNKDCGQGRSKRGARGARPPDKVLGPLGWHGAVYKKFSQ